MMIPQGELDGTRERGRDRERKKERGSNKSYHRSARLQPAQSYSTDRVMTALVSLQGAKYIHVHLVLVQGSADKDCLRENSHSNN